MYWRVNHECTVLLHSPDDPIWQKWKSIWGSYGRGTGGVPAVHLHCRLVSHLDSLPAGEPIFQDTRLGPADQFGNLTVIRGEDGDLSLHFYRGAIARLKLGEGQLRAEVQVTRELLDSPRFEDVLFTSLAPLLRRCGLYLIHSFAAVRDGDNQACLLVGPSGSGKTTTGLNLLLNGWRLLANDVVLLEARRERIWALPTPGVISVRRHTFELLPTLQQLTNGLPDHDVSFSCDVISRWANPAPISKIFFPAISADALSTVKKKSTGVALARMMEESLDRWDEAYLEAHSAVLSALVGQADVFHLRLGRDFHQLPDRL